MNNMDISAFSGVQKAAILIMYLERDVSRKLLENLSDAEVKEIGLAMAQIERVTPNEIEAVIGEFLKELVDTAMVNRSGPDFVKKVLPDLVSEDRQSGLIRVIHRRVNTDFEDFIRARQPGAVAALLKEELPQVQAVALSLMGPSNASRILRYMDQQRQAEVTMRMSKLRQIPGDLADGLIASITSALGQTDDYLEVGGIDKTARILGKMRTKDQASIIGAVEDEDAELAELLQRRMVVFEDLRQLDRRSMQSLLKNVDKDDMLRALKGADPEMVDFFLSNVSKRQAADIAEELEIMGGIQKSAIREAQENIVAEAIKLSDEGVIYLDMGGDDDEE